MDLSWLAKLSDDAGPAALAGAALDLVPLLGWEALNGILAAEGADVLTVARGALVTAPRPRDLASARRLLAAGVSTLVRAAERHDRGLARLAAEVAARVPGEVHVQVYVTPGGTNSFGWHYDLEEVLIVQTLGVKDYYLRENTTARDARLGEALDFSPILQERSPLLVARLLAGDCLRIPSRWWHLVKCVEDSLSISIGVMAPETLRQARRIPKGWGQKDFGLARPNGQSARPLAD